MRIVFLHTAALPAGWTGLIAGWVAHHPQPDVFALTAGGPQPLQAQTVGSSRTGPFPVSWRQNRQLRRLCPDVVVDASATAPLVLKGPRLLLLPDPALLQQLAGPTGPRQAWLRYRLRKKLRQATRVVVPTAFAAAQLHRVIPLHPGQPAVVPLLPGAAFQPLPPAAREAVKEQVTGGVEYFLYTGSLAAGGQVLRLLKAFSAFKKRQQSSMRLVLAGAVPRKQEAAFKKMLSTYKYRADVVVLPAPGDAFLAELMGGAYAVVQTDAADTTGLLPLQAIGCRVPVLAPRESAAAETGGAACLYLDSASVDELAQKLMLLYKDETLRARLIANGQAQREQFSPERAEKLWEAALLSAAD